MSHNSLRFSDFFGSENIPEGRDAGEEVPIDPDVLRPEVRNLMRLTEKQIGSLKRGLCGWIGCREEG